MKSSAHLAIIALSAIMAVPVTATAEELRIGSSTDIDSLDPHNRYQISELAVHRHIFEPLVFQDERQQLEPGLAESWTALEDTVWEFKLRENVLFHDGTAFTSEDVEATLRRVPDVETTGGYAAFVSEIDEIEIVDDHTIRFHTPEAHPTLPYDLSAVVILPAEVAADVTIEDFNSGEAAIGTGPFRLNEWVRGEHLRLDAFEDYWGPDTPWTSVTLRPLTSSSARIAALRNGEVDLVESVPTADVDALEATGTVRLSSGPTNRVIYLYLDQRDETDNIFGPNGEALDANPLQDRRVREALSKAIDRDAIVENIMESYAVAAGQVLPSGFFGSVPGLEPDTFDPDLARDLLEEAGYGDGLQLTIHGPNDRYPNDADVVQAIAQMLTRVGLQSDVDTMPRSIFFSRASNLEFSINLQGWGSTGEAGSVLRAILATYDADTGFGAYNVGRYSNPEFDSLLAEALANVDDEAREEMFQQATTMAMEDYALIPLYFQMAIWATRDDLEYLPRTDEMTLATGVRLAE